MRIFERGYPDQSVVLWRSPSNRASCSGATPPHGVSWRHLREPKGVYENHEGIYEGPEDIYDTCFTEYRGTYIKVCPVCAAVVTSQAYCERLNKSLLLVRASGLFVRNVSILSQAYTGRRKKSFYIFMPHPCSLAVFQYHPKRILRHQQTIYLSMHRRYCLLTMFQYHQACLERQNIALPGHASSLLLTHSVSISSSMLGETKNTLPVHASRLLFARNVSILSS